MKREQMEQATELESQIVKLESELADMVDSKVHLSESGLETFTAEIRCFGVFTLEISRPELLEFIDKLVAKRIAEVKQLTEDLEAL